MIPPKSLILGLLPDLLSYHQLLLFLSLGIYEFDLHLSPPILLHCLHLLTASLVILHLSVFLQLQLLHQSVFHHLALLLLPALILVLCSEKRLPAIQTALDVLIEPFSALLIVIFEKTATSLPNLQGLSVFTQGLEWDERGLQIGCGRIFVKIALAELGNRQVLQILLVPHHFFFLEADGLFKLVIIDSFECVLVVETGILVYFDGLNDPWIDLLPKLLPMMFFIGVIDTIDFLHVYSILEESTPMAFGQAKALFCGMIRMNVKLAICNQLKA